MTYIPEHFKIQELVSRDMFIRNQHQPHKLWLLFDMYLLQEADRLRKRYGACYVNNWHNGGNLQGCGFREERKATDFSQHHFGRALDLHFVKVTAEEVRQELIKDCQQGRNEIIKGIELKVSWLHIDTRNSDKLFLFSA